MSRFGMPLIRKNMGYGWDSSFSTVREKFYREMVGNKKPKTVVDLGAGKNPISQKIFKNQKLMVFDISKDSLTSLNNPNLIRLRCDASRIPLKSASTDFCIATEVLEHLENPQEMVLEISRILSEDGFLLLSTPNRNKIKFNFLRAHEEHVSEMKLNDLIELLDSSGFAVKEVYGIGLNIPLWTLLGFLFQRISTKISRKYYLKMMKMGKRKPFFSQQICLMAKKKSSL